MIDAIETFDQSVLLLWESVLKAMR
jgi:hypothetical protein